MLLKEYLVQRFVKNNHNKYFKYCNEWINNITEDQKIYFIIEKEHLNL